MIRRTLRKFIIRRADVLITHGRSGYKYLRQLGALPQQIKVAPYATRAAEYESVPLERTDVAARRWLWLGQFIERKGLVPFVEALSKWLVARPGERVEVWFAGSGVLEPWLRNVATPCNFRLQFIGQLPRENLGDVFAQCGLLFLPTLADEWGMVVNEAMSGGLPVAGSVLSQAVDEMVEEGKNGWRFDPTRPGEFESVFDRVVRASDATLYSMRSAARSTALAWSPEWSAARFCRAVRLAFGGAKTACI